MPSERQKPLPLDQEEVVARTRSVASKRAKVSSGIKAVASQGQKLRSRVQQTRAGAAALTELSAATGAACHDVLHARKYDAWSLAFAYLTSQSLAGLGAAELAGNSSASQAMLWNLQQLARAASVAFDGQSYAMHPWLRCIEKLGGADEQPYNETMHPQADTLSETLGMVRNTGPISFREVRKLYAMSNEGLHIVRS